jgi:N-acetylglucosamine kinase-like BadF-type ATPase
MFLIADSGSTKTEWCVVSGNNIQKVRTEGISPYFHSTERILEILDAELLPHISSAGNIREVFYYGTGCTTENMQNIIRYALAPTFPHANVHITYDLVAAAHALCGTEKGIACILGTGSNSGYYNGSVIEKNIPGLGYVLGDEGSGSYLGKKLVAEYLYDNMDADLKKKFEEKYVDNEKLSVLEKVYSQPLANRYLSTMSLFLGANRGNEMIEKIITEGLDDFFSRHISKYKESAAVPVHFTGSIAWHYRDVIVRLCSKYGFQPGNIIKEPMDNLLNYYKNLGEE